MSPPRPGDLYLARLLSKPPYRYTLYAVFALTGVAALYLRAILGRSEQVLPWYLAPLAIYGFVMAALSAGARPRVVYLGFGALVAMAFGRQLYPAQARLGGLVEAGLCLLILAVLASLSRDAAFLRGAAVLESARTSQSPHEPGSTTPEG